MTTVSCIICAALPASAIRNTTVPSRISTGPPAWKSRAQDYNVSLPTHYSDCVPAGGFRWEGLRPDVFVNTWNHLFSEKPDTSLKYNRIAAYPISEGARLK